MKKIAFFMNNLYGGGAEKVLQTILNNFDFNNREVTLYAFSQAELDRNVYTSPIKYKSIFGKSTGVIKKIKGYIFSHFSPKLSYKLLIKEDYDIVIAFTEGEVTKLVSGAPEKCKKIAWVHTDMIKNPWTDFLFSSVESESECYKKFNKIFFVSADAKKAFVDKYSVDNEKTFVFSNPIDSNEIIIKSQTTQLLKKQKSPLLIFIGRLETVKGIDRLLKTAKELIDEDYEFELWILGTGSLNESVVSFINNNSLQENIKVLGFQANPYVFLKEADFLLSPSYAEAFSLVSAEAIILGKPVFATDCAGIRQTIEDAGIVVNNTDEDFYLMLKNLLSGKYDFEKLKKNCTRVSKKYNIENKMAEFYKAIEE